MILKPIIGRCEWFSLEDLILILINLLFTGLFTTGKKCSEEVMGYEVYTSALADVLCEPSLAMPLTVGMYARWGSGKSFVLRRLQGMNLISQVLMLGRLNSYFS